MIIYLCRHGNRGPDGSDLGAAPPLLTDRGHDQARRLGRYIEQQRPEALLCSPKIRCVQTAQPAADYLQVPIIVWPCLIEHNSFGPLDYSIKVFESMGAFQVPKMLLPDTPQHEDMEFAYKRAVAAIEQMRGGFRRVAIFAHDCFNSVFIWAWLNRGPLTEKDRYYQNECCVNILEDGKEPQINLDMLGM